MKYILFIVLNFYTINIVRSQLISVTVELNRKHVIGGIESFDRSKFITTHASIFEGDSFNEEEKLNYLLFGLDTYFGRSTGDITTNISLIDKNEMPIIGLATKEAYKSFKTMHIYESHEDLILACQAKIYQDLNKDGVTMGIKVGTYFNDYFGNGGETGPPKPKYFEVFNEPLWDYVDYHAYYGNPISNEEEVIDSIFRFYREAAIEIKKLNPELQVGGYCAAFPDLELGNFCQWDQRWKKFIDSCGSYMDFYSFHLYDFPGFSNGLKKFRKGGNMEATMDMIAQYDYLVHNSIKPFIISEYGSQLQDWYNQPWTPFRDWLILKAFSSMMVQYMERPDVILKAIPFAVFKALWGGGSAIPYPWRLMRNTDEPNSFSGKWVWTEVIKFYQLWSNVCGIKLDTRSSDLDLQVDAYLNNDKVYLILNNIDFKDVTVKIKNLGLGDCTIDSVFIKHLHLVGDKPVLDSLYYTSIPELVNIGAEATMILEYTLNKNLVPDQSLNETKYYADSYKHSIKMDVTDTFRINQVRVGTKGYATLRVGIGRNHGLSLHPDVKFNNVDVQVPTDYRGDSQDDRETFFGMLEIDVPYASLRNQNYLTITFPDTGGFISSVALQVFDIQEN